MNYRIFGEIYCGKTLAQMNSAMSQPFALKGALMPDAHAGYSLPIGGVVLTPHGVVVPAWVGYDIGCGMCASKLAIKGLTKEELLKIKERILQDIPMGTAKNKDNGNYKVKGFTEFGEHVANTRGQGQLGTLGGGNHFIELGQDESGLVWVCIHSGSRGVGHAVATHYMKEAAALAGVTAGNVEGHYPLKVTNGELYINYMKDMRACINWARVNRGLMMSKIIQGMQEVLGRTVKVVDRIDNTHNTADLLQEGCLHRKGATSAKVDERGIIPGNMRDGFFVVKGLGNKDSLNSASHGAGRVMSRGQAKEAVNFEKFKEEMADVVTNISPATIDESPDAYKSIFEVMDSQATCVDILHYVTPILNLKG